MSSARRSLCRRAVLAVAAAVLLGGCFTGQRPRLVEATLETGDANVDAVLALLGTAPDPVFTGRYRFTAPAPDGEVEGMGTVAQDGASRRSVTVAGARATLRFLVTRDGSRTCELPDGPCADGLDASRLSDLQLTVDFYGASAAAQLRRDAAQRVGPTTPSTETLAARSATCVAVPLSGGTSTYCALESGALARLEAADKTITLIHYEPTVRERAFSEPG